MKIVSRALLLSILTTVTLIGSSTVAMAAGPDSSASRIEKTDKTAEVRFMEKKFDFGIVAEKGGPVSHSFEFTNTGTAPLVIISATASCGCTRPTYPTEPIAPGKKGTIKVTYLPEGRPGEFTKVVKVRTNAKESKKISLTITGTVRP